MGRIPSDRGDLGDGNLFGDLPLSREKKSPFVLETSGRGLNAAPKPPDQTNPKAKLIAEYISNFQRITKGGLFIDGFAAPQSRGHEDAWSAGRVLAIEPARLRTFWLCDLDPAGIAQLRRLKEQHHQKPRWRRVFVMEGDFNQLIDAILASGRLCCTNRPRDSSRESSVVAGWHEQTDTPRLQDQELAGLQ